MNEKRENLPTQKVFRESLSQVKEFHFYSGHPISEELKLITLERAKERMDYIREELQEFEDAVAAGDLIGAIDALDDAQYFIEGTRVEMGVMPGLKLETFSEVHRANMTKFCHTEAVAIETVEQYGAGTHPLAPGRIIEADYREQGDLWVVFDKHSKKILKSIHTESPNTEPIINKYK